MSGGPADVFTAAARLYREGVPFVLATVVRAERPTSARPGAKAIVTGDGAFVGFVGGTCVKPAVRRESLRALADGRAPVTAHLSRQPHGGGRDGGRSPGGAHACVSGGALDIHLEPYLPSRRLVLAGNSPIVESLATLGAALGMEVRTAEAGEELAEAAEGAFVVVAGHGEGEWDALKAGLAGGRARYVGLVASPRRAAAVRERLAAMGVSAEDVARLRSPAGLDIGAESPGEIALSILAEIVEERRAPDQPEAASKKPEPAPAVGISLGSPADDTAVDPICGMTVSRDSPHRVESEGETYWFCCAGCAQTFAAQAG